MVFVTAHDEHALRAFEENAVDYLLKPVSRDRLGKTVERLRAQPDDPGLAGQLRAALRRIPCLAGPAIRLVDVSEIELARSSEAGVYVVTPTGELFTELTLRGEGAATLRTRSGRDVPVSRRLLPVIRERLGI